MDEHTKTLLQALIDGKQLEKLCGDKWKVSVYPLVDMHNYAYKHMRVKQPTIRIGEMDVPEPLRVAPAKGTRYWLAQTTNEGLPYPAEWIDDSPDQRWLNRGLVHLTEEAAVAHAKALIAVSGGTV